MNTYRTNLLNQKKVINITDIIANTNPSSNEGLTYHHVDLQSLRNILAFMKSSSKGSVSQIPGGEDLETYLNQKKAEEMNLEQLSKKIGESTEDDLLLYEFYDALKFLTNVYSQETGDYELMETLERSLDAESYPDRFSRKSILPIRPDKEYTNDFIIYHYNNKY